MSWLSKGGKEGVRDYIYVRGGERCGRPSPRESILAGLKHVEQKL
jgi:hypothetical protein